MPDLPDAAITAAADVIDTRWPHEIFDEAEVRAIATTALEAAAPALREAERERIKVAGAVSACCGAEYNRERGKYDRWHCHGCGNECDLIGVIA